MTLPALINKPVGAVTVHVVAGIVIAPAEVIPQCQHAEEDEYEQPVIPVPGAIHGPVSIAGREG